MATRVYNRLSVQPQIYASYIRQTHGPYKHMSGIPASP